jgi:UDP-N-acetylmuramoyl-tripeptide--D-alanyl-D-alanine ligase
MTLTDLAALCGGTLLRGDPSTAVGGISIDSRTVRKGELFLALVGERFDGHDFAKAALSRGAAGIIGTRGRLLDLAQTVDNGAGLIGVDDTLAALHSLASGYRARFRIPLIAVTGSCGKTTTKDMLAAILARTRKTLKTEGNLNNLIGAPLMLLRLDRTVEAGVIEIASNAPGEIGTLARILAPTGGVITNVGPVHLEGLGSIDGVFAEKRSLIPHISRDGFLVIGEGIQTKRVCGIFEGKIITFGARKSDFRATRIRQSIKEGTEFLLNGKEPIRIPIPGAHNVRNALAAIAAATQLGAGIDSIREALAGVTPGNMRMQTLTIRGVTIVNDAYNANPLSMRESIATVTAMPAARRVLVLGGMLELGEYAREEHRLLGRYIGPLKVDLVCLKGEFSPAIVEGAIEGGMREERLRICADAKEIADSLRGFLRAGDLVLVKGSRGMRMEEVIRLLQEGD